MGFWKKLKYWQKGMLIGFLIGTLIVHFTLINLMSLPEGLGKFLYNYLFDNGEKYCGMGNLIWAFVCEWLLIIPLILPFIIFGALTGYTLQLKNQKKVRSK